MIVNIPIFECDCRNSCHVSRGSLTVLIVTSNSLVYVTCSGCLPSVGKVDGSWCEHYKVCCKYVPTVCRIYRVERLFSTFVRVANKKVLQVNVGVSKVGL